MSDVFAERRAHTDGIVASLKTTLERELGSEGVAIGDQTCVYATGSCGRGEMGQGSDLDAYIVRMEGQVPTSSNLIEDAVEVAAQEAGLPPMDGGGKYLEPVNVRQVLDLLGAPKDDASGVLTKRILLLLESRVLLGEAAHRELVSKVVDAYWSNDSLHPSDYLPIVLVNDIVRYWRIVLLNHESKLRKKQQAIAEDATVESSERDAVLLAHRRYRSYKLRLPRCLTCFSALTYLLALTPEDPANVTKHQVREMIELTPLQRLRALPALVGRDLGRVEELLSGYGTYLERTDVGKTALLVRLQQDVEMQRAISRDGRRFTEVMFGLVQELGGGRPLHRHMLV